MGHEQPGRAARAWPSSSTGATTRRSASGSSTWCRRSAGSACGAPGPRRSTTPRTTCPSSARCWSGPGRPTGAGPDRRHDGRGGRRPRDDVGPRRRPGGGRPGPDRHHRPGRRRASSAWTASTWPGAHASRPTPSHSRSPRGPDMTGLHLLPTPAVVDALSFDELEDWGPLDEATGRADVDPRSDDLGGRPALGRHLGVHARPVVLGPGRERGDPGPRRPDDGHASTAASRSSSAPATSRSSPRAGRAPGTSTRRSARSTRSSDRPPLPRAAPGGRMTG